MARSGVCAVASRAGVDLVFLLAFHRMGAKVRLGLVFKYCLGCEEEACLCRERKICVS
jgi:hypothetical protein